LSNRIESEHFRTGGQNRVEMDIQRGKLCRDVRNIGAVRRTDRLSIPCAHHLARILRTVLLHRPPV